jgi:hypothetical protein
LDKETDTTVLEIASVGVGFLHPFLDKNVENPAVFVEKSRMIVEKSSSLLIS